LIPNMPIKNDIEKYLFVNQEKIIECMSDYNFNNIESMLG